MCLCSTQRGIFNCNFFFLKENRQKTLTVASLTKLLLLKTYFSVWILISLMSRAVWSWMNMCFSRCSFLIKIVPLGCNWCYQRLGWSHMGGELQVRLRWYRGAEETGSLCAILSGLRSELRSSRLDWTPLVCTVLPLHRECTELLWTPLVFIVSTGAWISPASSHVGSFSTSYIKRAQCYDHCIHRVSEGIRD